VFPADTPCDHRNTTAFIARLIAFEKPDLVVHTGDIVDWGTHPSRTGMDELYGVSAAADTPWAATLGNHDEQSDLTRQQVMDYVINGMRRNGSLGFINPLGPNQTTPCGADGRGLYGQDACPARFGNFYLEVFANETATGPGFRSFHLDSTVSGPGQNGSIIPEQIDWFQNTSEGFSDAVAAVAFFHIPLKDMDDAAKSPGAKISGSFNEAIMYEGSTPGLMDAFVASGTVKATFSGHDHTNDFCIESRGIQLCYEGSPGYQAYGLSKPGYPRRARVTEVRHFGKSITSWKRLDDDHMTMVDAETLWSAQDDLITAPKQRHFVDVVAIAKAPSRSQK